MRIGRGSRPQLGGQGYSHLGRRQPTDLLTLAPAGCGDVERYSVLAKFMALAFLLEALITLYVPTEWITRVLGDDGPLTILLAAALGVPAYTSNLAALPMIGGLLTQGMNPAAALTFLVAGPTTTLPAMAAVWGLSTRRVFALYVSFAFVGAVITGLAYALVAAL